jgi:hypothetical protein
MWQGQSVDLSLIPGDPAVFHGTGNPLGQLTTFATTDPTLSCLSSEGALNVWEVHGSNNEYVVVAQKPGDCVDADFSFASTGA